MRIGARCALVGLVAVGAAACGGSTPTSTSVWTPPQSPCVGGFQQGQVLSVRLGAIYDAASEYYYDGSLEAPYLSTAASCGGADGLTTGALVSFTLQGTDPSSAPYGSSCLPWVAALSPEAVTDAQPGTSSDVPYVDGVTIATSFAAGSLGGSSVLATRALFTPSANAYGDAGARQLPPLVVTRAVHRDWQVNDTTPPCYDAWIATWQP